MTRQNETRTFTGRMTARFVQSRRRIGTVAAFATALLLGYHVVAGENGLTVYKQKLAEDRKLTADVRDQQQENDRLKKHVENLRNNPDASEHEINVRLRYTKPLQVIVLNDPSKAATETPAAPVQ